MENNGHADLLRGLQQLAAGAFPRICPTCGRVYQSFEQFLRETTPLGRHSGLKAVTEEDDRIAVEVYRNCVCGSTLMDLAQDRRDESEAGRERRRRFEAMLEQLTRRGLERETARSELRRMMRGEASPLIEKLLRENR